MPAILVLPTVTGRANALKQREIDVQGWCFEAGETN